MAHWFHRNPFKATAAQPFDVKKISVKSNFNKVLSDLRNARNDLLKLFTSPLASIEKMEEVSNRYFGLIQGLFEVPDSSNASQNDGNSQHPDEDESKPKGRTAVLKTFFKFKWTQSLDVDKKPIIKEDAMFDFVNMGINVALWYSKHAAQLASQPDIKMEDAKEIHTCLRKAAGIFKEFKETHVGKLSSPPEKGSDLDDNILAAYIVCCQAEAQEVTIARAVEKKHTAKLIAGLANETSQIFHNADDYLKSQDDNLVGKWRKYLQLKKFFYKSYALSYSGSALLDQEKCGDSIRCLEDSSEMFTKAGELCKDYISTKGAGSTIRPNEHQFYTNFAKDMARKLEKSKNENGFIYHQKVPPVAPNMDLKATHGLVEPHQFTVPDISPQWTADVYAGFIITKNTEKDKKSPKKSEKDEPVQNIVEPDITVTKDSNCVIS